ncbi:hypothetical protein [Mycolicibacterium mengxianglii]|uniref:hypothetical protein n=1 Tax=Mycolicibacterium mengxianglii TaxID=2736649 RepID=UPI0018D190BE|nr:hypothetical protein [Mycolicibacterium mengxianglii]
MTEAMALLYLIPGLITAAVTFALGRRWRDFRQPATHPVVLSVIAGMLWPLVLVGVVQFASIALVTRIARSHHRAAGYSLAG